ncbi:MAG: DUF2975 domain-containing protein [Alistipes sp.]|nr:DUF2975 domain-containing protein [Alistipes senegalensis]MCM1249556.1 DUF2975 domain-containing protein [Alistipes sp.]
MQNKKRFLQRLLAIYIAFFLVIVAGLALEVLPGFARGFVEGNEMGTDMTRNWALGAPRMIYMLEGVRIVESPEDVIPTPELAQGIDVKTHIRKIGLTVEEEAPGASIFTLSFRSVGGSGWIYLAIMLCSLAYLAIIVLMFLIIHSLRRSIREEHPLERRNVGLLRIIGLLAIVTELLHDTMDWTMSSRAAELLSGSGYVVDTAFHVSYSTILMGVLILFAAEVFAVGRNLSEEQKLTI